MALADVPGTTSETSDLGWEKSVKKSELVSTRKHGLLVGNLNEACSFSYYPKSVSGAHHIAVTQIPAYCASAHRRIKKSSLGLCVPLHFLYLLLRRNLNERSPTLGP